MAAPRLKVGGFDFSVFLRLQPDEGQAIDPTNQDYFRPQFSGTPALSEGTSWVADAVDNRTQMFPIYFTAENRTAIKALIREANEALVKGAQVEFCIDPDVEGSSFFDLERGVLLEEFNFYHLVNGVAGATLQLTTRPYANSATHRLIASIPQGSAAVVKFAATGIAGDAYALAGLEVRVGSAAASAGRVVAWGIHPHPSHNPYREAVTALAQASSTLQGASGAIGSTYVKIPVSPTGASGIAYQAFLDPVAAHVGRHRVIAIGRSGLSAGIPLYAVDNFGAVLGPTAIASQTDVNKWQVIDLGEVNVPARASGQEPVPTQSVSIMGGGASGQTINASPGFHLAGIMFLPLDYSAGILRTKGAGGAARLYEDSFDRFVGLESRMEQQPDADKGGKWLGNVGQIGAVYGGAVKTKYWLLPGTFAAGKVETEGGGGHKAIKAVPNASAAANLNKESIQHDVLAQITVGLSPPSGMATTHAASAAVVFYPAGRTGPGSEETAPLGGVGAKLQFGPSQMLQIVSASANGATAVLASAGIASTLASGLYLGQQHVLTMQIRGPRMDVWLATGPVGASPVLSASAPDALGGGWPILAVNSGSNVASGVAYVDDLTVQSLAAGGSDVGPRETFRFESHPEGRVVQGNASVFVADRLADYRGQFPKMPPVPTNATGPARVVVLQGEVDNIVGNDGPNIALTVLERFRFLA